MPLSKDDPNLDYDGSWGDASKDWPYIEFSSAAAAMDAYMTAWKVCKVPYGSYVIVGRRLRLENQRYIDRVKAELAKKTS